MRLSFQGWVCLNGRVGAARPPLRLRSQRLARARVTVVSLVAALLCLGVLAAPGQAYIESVSGGMLGCWDPDAKFYSSPPVVSLSQQGSEVDWYIEHVSYWTSAGWQWGNWGTWYSKRRDSDSWRNYATGFENDNAGWQGVMGGWYAVQQWVWDGERQRYSTTWSKLGSDYWCQVAF